MIISLFISEDEWKMLYEAMRYKGAGTRIYDGEVLAVVR